MGTWSEQSPSSVSWGGWEEGRLGLLVKLALLAVSSHMKKDNPKIVKSGSPFLLQTKCFPKSQCKHWEVKSNQMLRKNNQHKGHFLTFPKTRLSIWVPVTDAWNSLRLQSADQQHVSCLGMTRPTCTFQGLLQVLQCSGGGWEGSNVTDRQEVFRKAWSDESRAADAVSHPCINWGGGAGGEAFYWES